MGDEGGLDVELGEFGLAVGAEVLVAVAPGDLVVLLEAADHEQLLEQLRGLRQGVPVAGLEADRDQEVAGALGVERVSVGVSISTKPSSASRLRAMWLAWERRRIAWLGAARRRSR
ncbi:hypothetical protein GCM10029992_40330 [Glycomyces albus]